MNGRMNLTKSVRTTVLERDLHVCQRCGEYVGISDYSIHHRRPKGMGGSKDPATNLPANLITLCGSGTTKCHGWVESHRSDALYEGFILHQAVVPELRPVKTYRGWIRLDNEGGWREAFGSGDLSPDERNPS